MVLQLLQVLISHSSFQILWVLQTDYHIRNHTEYLRKKVLRQSDTEIAEIDEQIQQEIKDGILPDPSQVDPITGEPVGGDLGDVPTEDDLESQGAVTDAQLSNDTNSAEI